MHEQVSEYRASSRDTMHPSATDQGAACAGLPGPHASDSPRDKLKLCCSSLASSRPFPHLGLCLFICVGSSFRG